MKTTRLHLCGWFFLLVVLCGVAQAGPGAWDQSFAPVVGSGPVYAMGLQPNGQLIIGGAFVFVGSQKYASSTYHLARLNSDGSVDANFQSNGSGVSANVWSLAIQTDGRIVIGGDFTAINGTARAHVARLNSNGAVDGSFLPTNTINSSVLAVAVQTNNAVVIGGTFSGGTFPSWLARLNADGTTDTTFTSAPNATVYAVGIQTDGKILIGGAFQMVNGAVRNHIARLNSDGSLDTTFQNGLTGASAAVRCLQIQPDGKILIGGDFASVNGIARNYVARLNTDGSTDTGFVTSTGANGSVYAVAEQPNSSVVIGGIFSAYGTANLGRVARLYADGSRDTTFTNYGINNIVYSLAIQNDGRICVCGSFTTENFSNCLYLCRLYGDLYPPEFLVQPASKATNVGASVTFSSQVSNPTASSFQWRKDGANISGATDISYTVNNVQFPDAGNYSVFVSNAAGGTTSSNALLQVGIFPAITAQPSSLTVTQGQSASFSVTATGTPLNYFWKKNGSFISGQTNASLNFASADPTNAATYTCQVSNFLGSVTSTGAVLTVVYPPVIVSQPAGLSVGAGSNFTVSVVANGFPALNYQWRTNGTPIPGATAASYSVTNAQGSDSANYDVVITNALGSVTSSVAIVSVIFYPPTITLNPVGGNVPVGSNFILNASATGTAPLNWQWRTNGTPIPGATASSYTNSSARLADAAGYDAVVANAWGSMTSAVALVNVGYAPVVAQPPLSVTNVVGGTANFSCIVTGTLPINLQWTFNGYPLANETNSIFSVTNLQISEIGFFALTATNLFGGTASSNAALNLSGYDFNIWNGLVAYYPFSGNANDASGNGNNGTVIGATLTADRFGITNSAYAFNGVSNFITVADFPQADVGARTVSAWLEANTWTNIPAISYYVDILAKEDFAPGEHQWVFKGMQTGQLRWTVFTSSGEYDLDTVARLQTNRWYQVVSVWDGTNESVYINGALDSSIPAPGAAIPGMAPVRIGGNPFDVEQFFGGNLDEVRIYNRALTSNDVASLYALEAPPAVPPPITLNASLGAGPNFNLNLTGVPGQNYVLQTATNLAPPVQWLPVLTNAADTNGLWQFTDTNLDSAQKFYRVTTP